MCSLIDREKLYFKRFISKAKSREKDSTKTWESLLWNEMEALIWIAKCFGLVEIIQAAAWAFLKVQPLVEVNLIFMSCLKLKFLCLGCMALWTWLCISELCETLCLLFCEEITFEWANAFEFSRKLLALSPVEVFPSNQSRTELVWDFCYSENFLNRKSEFLLSQFNWNLRLKHKTLLLSLPLELFKQSPEKSIAKVVNVDYDREWSMKLGFHCGSKQNWSA